MPTIPFGEWLPDQPDYQNPGVLKATNVFPIARGYLPVPSLEVITDATDDRPRGAIRITDKSGNVRQYVGDESKLYENVSESWTDRSIMGGYSTGSDEAWEFVQWNEKVLATNFTDNPQQLTLGSTTFSNLTTDFKSRHIAVIRDFVVHGYTDDDPDGKRRVRWSAFGDETDYTVSASTLSDFNDLKSGEIRRIFGGEFGVILMNDDVYRMTFIGSPPVFQFDNVLPQIGVISRGAAARDGDTVYFLSDKGFFALVNGTKAQPIGATKVDRFVLNDLDISNAGRISATVDPNSHRFFLAYPGQGNTGGRPNKIIIYDRALNRWSIIEKDVELVWQASGSGQTLETLDNFSSSIDSLELSLDSRAWVGGAVQIAAFDSDKKSGFFSGSPMTGVIESKEFEIHSGHRTHLNSFRPLTSGGSITARVGTRNRQIDDVSYTTDLSLGSTGKFTCRENARYHRLEFTLAGEWTEAFGLQIDQSGARKAEKR